MKQKFTLLFSLMLLFTGAFAQSGKSKPATKKGPLVGIHLNAVDFITPETWKNSSSTREAAKLKDMDFGGSISYWKGWTPYIDFSAKLNFILHDYAGDRNKATDDTEAGIELEPTINLRPIPDNAMFSPFLTVGLGGGYYTGEFGAYAPVGLGVQFNFSSVTYLLLQANYKFTLTEDDLKDHLQYSIGILQDIRPEKPKEVPPPPPPPPPVVLDRDNDGVLDADDRCPDVAGLSSLQGCPDNDKDGIANMDDKCPDVAGLAKYNGCPIPDTDGDGVNDEQDQCINEKGVARYQGCPIPDGDGDGVNDEEDKCPKRVGPANNFGCPVIGIKSYEIVFKSSSAVLLPKGKAVLDTVVRYLNVNSDVSITIDGHTDNTGSDKINDPLSKKRAEATKAYIASKGIDPARMTTAGYGSKQPIADNKTADGKKKNRRIEIKIKQ